MRVNHTQTILVQTDSLRPGHHAVWKDGTRQLGIDVFDAAVVGRGAAQQRAEEEEEEERDGAVHG